MHLQRRCIGSREAIIVNYRDDYSGTSSVAEVVKEFRKHIENKDVVAVKRYRALRVTALLIVLALIRLILLTGLKGLLDRVQCLRYRAVLLLDLTSRQ